MNLKWFLSLYFSLPSSLSNTHRRPHPHSHSHYIVLWIHTGFEELKPSSIALNIGYRPFRLCKRTYTLLMLIISRQMHTGCWSLLIWCHWYNPFCFWRWGNRQLIIFGRGFRLRNSIIDKSSSICKGLSPALSIHTFISGSYLPYFNRYIGAKNHKSISLQLYWSNEI